MARKTPDPNELFMNVMATKKRAEKIQDNINTSYKDTYYSDNSTSNAISSIRRQMDNSINGLIDKTKLRTGETNMSSLYARTLAKNDDSMIRELQHTLQDESMLADIMDLYSQNMITRDMDREIDVVCKYMPKLDQALDIKADHVLSADHFNKDYLRITILNSTKDGNETIDTTKYSTKSDSIIETFKKKYDLERLTRKIYVDTAKYGEQFVYVISYNKALERLVQKSAGATLLSESVVQPGAYILNEEEYAKVIQENTITMDFAYMTHRSDKDSKILKEEVYYLNEADNNTLNALNNVNTETDINNIKVEINTTGVIPSIISSQSDLNRILGETSLIFGEARVKTGWQDVPNNLFSKGIGKDFKSFYGRNTLAPPAGMQDGLTDLNSRKNNGPAVNVPGCIVELLDHTMIKPLYIRNMPLGYYYIETDSPLDVNEQTTFSTTLGGLRPRRSTRDRENMNSQRMDKGVLLRIAKQISTKIDKKFINANQDLAQEIYTILKYNADHAHGKASKIRISFIPPEDIVHSYFNLNDKNHRGKSDLSKSLFPAKLYSCLYISNTIALLTRGYDKRVYHVKQAVDTNITAVLLNVINQIKQSNFNLRQIENMNNILNITGRFNDLVIPQNANGESPVTFEVMPGQNIEIKTDFMNMLEEVAVNETGVSLEMTNSRLQEQTATHITMTNTRFLMKIFARQKLYEEILSSLYTKIYQNEFQNNDILQVELPPPVMLKFTNTSQILALANELIQNITTMKMGSEQDEELKSMFTGKLMRYYFNSFLPMDEIDKLADDARVDLQVKRNAEQAAGNSGQPQY